jgi:hypothetical protein
MKTLATVDIGGYFLALNGGAKFSQLTSVGAMVTFFLNLSFVIAGLILLFYFIMGGIGMISSAGKDDPKAKEMAKQSITYAVMGFVIVLTAYWVVILIGMIFGYQFI